MSDNPLPCPFCGSEAVESLDVKWKGFFRCSNGIGLEGGDCWHRNWMLLEHWNRRPEVLVTIDDLCRELLSAVVEADWVRKKGVLSIEQDRLKAMKPILERAFEDADDAELQLKWLSKWGRQ